MKLQIQDLSNDYLVKKIRKEDIPTVYELCKGNPYYYEHMKMQPTPENLTEVMTELPPGKTADDKFFVGFWKEDKLVAILDLIVAYPDKNTAFIGWFMMNHDYQGQGIGSEIMQKVLACMKGYGMKQARLGYIKGNRQARNFWLKNGFQSIGTETDTGDYTVVVLERKL